MTRVEYVYSNASTESFDYPVFEAYTDFTMRDGRSFGLLDCWIGKEIVVLVYGEI